MEEEVRSPRAGEEAPAADEARARAEIVFALIVERRRLMKGECHALR